MKLLAAILLVLATSAPALAAQDLLCVRDATAGAPSYLLVIKNSVPDGTALILEKNFSVFRSAWQVDYSDAKATRAADGGPLSVTGALDPKLIDWESPEHANQCFIPYKEMSFNLNESGRGTKGTLTITAKFADNPNMQPCPHPLPAPAQQLPISCSDY
jgi:hypothetical protein